MAGKKRPFYTFKAERETDIGTTEPPFLHTEISTAVRADESSEKRKPNTAG